MTQFLMFAGNAYYPDGGALDFRGYADSAQEAEASLKEICKDLMFEPWAHYVTPAGEVVEVPVSGDGEDGFEDPAKMDGVSGGSR